MTRCCEHAGFWDTWALTFGALRRCLFGAMCAAPCGVQQKYRRQLFVSRPRLQAASLAAGPLDGAVWLILGAGERFK